VLCIETPYDDIAVAVYDSKRSLLTNQFASNIDIRNQYDLEIPVSAVMFVLLE